MTATGNPIKQVNVMQMFGLMFTVKAGVWVRAADGEGVDHRARVQRVTQKGLFVEVDDPGDPQHEREYFSLWENVTIKPSYQHGRPLCRWDDDPEGVAYVWKAEHYPEPEPDDDLAG